MVSLFGRGFDSLQLHTKGGVSFITPPFCLPPNPTAIGVKYSISVVFPDFADLVLKSLFCPDFMCFTVMNHAHETNINVLVTNSGAKTDNSFYLCGRCTAHNAWLLNNMLIWLHGP